MDAARRLLDWYDANRRELPWRRDRDPYRVWVSEVMLQQTRVEVVVPYWERFVARFPTVAELAAAPLDDVLALWSGLGYYRRARQMHAAARVVAAAGGRFPETAEGLAALPGIGAYTAAAVASIAFGEPVPVIDGNVERVTARLLGLAGDPRAAPARRRLRGLAADLLAPGRPGDSNQALMELGATVCTPRRPRCERCPLREARPAAGPGSPPWPGCAAARSGDPEAFPSPRRRRPVERQRRLVAVAERDGCLLLFRRADDGEPLAGTWELPWVEAPDAGADGGAAGAAAALAARYGGRWRLGHPLGRVRHGITWRDLDLHAVAAAVDGAGELAEGGGPAAAWQPRSALPALPVSSLVGKVLAAVAAGVAGGPAAGAAPTPRRAGRRRG